MVISKIRIARKVPLILVLFLLNAGVSLAGQMVKRHILALYSSEQQTAPRYTRIHQNVETVLNHLGCIVEYHDIDTGLPDAATMQKYRGILTWFTHNQIKHKLDYMQWLPQQLKHGRKLVILGSLGGFQPDQAQITSEISKVFFRALGIECDDNSWDDNPAVIEIAEKNTPMVEFERSLDHELDYYVRVRPLNDSIHPLLILQKHNHANSRSVVIATSPWGGFALSPYIIYDDDVSFKRQWRLNPFKFFARAFDLHELPKPDITTRDGSRIWLSHIDGDALVSVSEIGAGKYCGEVVRDKILKAYDWPVSVSIVVAELLQDEKFDAIARSIFALDNVEIASHTYSHPFYWDENYGHKNEYKQRHLPIPGYKFNAQQEVIGAVEYIDNRLAPPDKKTSVYFWSGNCEPTAEAVRQCTNAAILNMNGGDTVFDKNTPSYCHVAPLRVPVGGQMQYYAVNSNENIYTNEWHGPFYGYMNSLRTFAYTGTPVRLRPINVYYHFYSGEKWAALNALKTVLDSSLTNDVAPLFVSEYLKIVQDFFTTEIEETGENRWSIRNAAVCRTIRFDDCDLQPELQQSRNVIGFLHHQNCLYVHLGSEKESFVVLTEKPAERVYLHQASHGLENVRLFTNNIEFSASGFGRGHFTFRNLLAQSVYSVRINGKKAKISTNEEGELRIECQMHGTTEFTVNRDRAEHAIN